jgi:AmmeMemoRadiSam system protein A
MNTSVYPDVLPSLARLHLQRILQRQAGMDPAQLADQYPELGEVGACFVTLTMAGQLRGCIGSLEPHRLLAYDLLENAVGAATRDPRFRPVTWPELEQIRIEVSMLTPPVLLEYQTTEELLATLQPHVHGIILSQGMRRATFLPQVWSQIPVPQQFLHHLCVKAGLSGECWQQHPTIHLYTVSKVHES